MELMLRPAVNTQQVRDVSTTDDCVYFDCCVKCQLATSKLILGNKYELLRLTDDGHERVEVADVDALLGDVDEILDHPTAVLLL